jgi:nitroreductase
MNHLMPNDVGITDAIYHRRAVRAYSDRAVTPEIVRELLLAAIQAPSALNQQPWAFAVFHGHQRLRDYSERAKLHLVVTYPTAFELHSRSELYEDPGYDVFHGADTVIVIYATRGHLHPNED